MSTAQPPEAPPTSPPDAEGPTEANKSWADQLQGTLAWMRAAGVGGVAKASFDETEKALAACRDSQFTRSSVERLRTAWAGLVGQPAVKDSLHTAGGVYTKGHDAVVRDERYAQALGGAAQVAGAVASVATSAFQKIASTDAYQSAAGTVGPTLSKVSSAVGPYAAAAADAVAPAVNATKEHFKPVKPDGVPAAPGEQPPAESPTDNV
mmetsp:Transcript_31644/g.81087  ORF Transcript_31644/g.81087 Transcript_31644/m.81087 type:complete len:208 (+) Transcript_31644:302-925(+)|eukprot:jgi/Tetstr1/461560/TSEL_006666.t1